MTKKNPTPTMDFCTDSYLADTGKLSTTEHGAYMLILIALWRSADASLSNDDRELAKVARMTLDRWRRISKTIRSLLIEDGDRVMQARICRDRAAIIHPSRRAGSASKPLKNKDATQNGTKTKNGGVLTSLTTPFLFDSVEEEQKVVSKKEAAPPKSDWPKDYAEQFWRQCPRRVAKGAAMRALEKVRRAGVPWAVLMAGVMRWAAEAARSEPRFVKHPATWLNAGCWDDEPAPPTNGHGLPLLNGHAHRGSGPGGKISFGDIVRSGLAELDEMSRRNPQ